MADPVTWTLAAIKGMATAYGTWATSHALAAAAVQMVGSSLLSIALAPKPKVAGGQSDFKADTDAGIPIVFGRTATGGNLVFQYPHGRKNRMLDLFTILSGCGPIEGIESFMADEQAVTFNASGVVTNTPSFKDQMFMTTRMGAIPDLALSQPGGQATADGVFTQWTSAHCLSGYASAWWVCQYDTEKLNSLPKPRWVLKGVKVYDPRQDSTYPGGAGPQRIDQPGTHTYSENPYLHAVKWLYGYWQNGKKVAGVGVPAENIDLPAFVAGANMAAAIGWKIGGVVTTKDSKWQILKAILQAGCGEPSELGAKVSCSFSGPRTSLATLTSNDLTSMPTLQAMMSRRDRINTVVPRYRSEEHNWEVVAADPVKVADYVTADGEPRTKEIEYPLCQNLTQAGQLAAYDLVNAREFQPLTLPVKPRWLGYQPGDCITVNIPELGLNSQKAVIIKRSSPDPATGAVTLTLRSETDAKHAFALGTSAVPPPTPGLTVPDFTSVIAPAVGAFSASVGYLTSGANALPAITVTGVGDNPFATDILIEYRIVGTSEWVLWTSAPATTTRFTITGLDAGQTYEIAVSYRTLLGGVGARRVYGPFVTGAVNAGQLSGVEGVAIINGLQSNLEGLAKEILSRQNLDAFTKASFYDGDGKSVKTIALNAVDKADNAVSALNVIGALTPDKSAFVFNAATVKVDGSTTLAQYVDATTTRVGTLETTVAIQQTSLNGISGKLSLSVTAPGGTGGIVIGAGPAGSYIGMAAAEFAIFDNSDTTVYTKPFSYMSGIITLNANVVINGNAVVNGTITTDKIVVRGVSDSAARDVPAINNLSSETTVASLVFNPDGGRVRVSFRLSIENTGGSDCAVRVKVFRNGVNMSGSILKKAGVAFTEVFTSYVMDYAGLSGNQTYSISVQTVTGQNIGDTGGSPYSAGNLQSGNLTLETFKR
ncbi:hypothetical protein AEAC466_13495 [Asticcacaulis sp. AC466]|uniref:phage tail protein n=1 Tax=Asticcacaulis sp. AC466 TaxID=1282362 RepID=UPI0003C3C6C3|nr:phage tail protein [Asticcacaulis sp. AC466]ESQ83261.1 hypothetical protein AEAC466_13495 [Asticcacaulis sp. AC466]